MTKPTDTTEGIELPTEPGVWKREEGDWAIIVRRASTAVGEALVFSGMKGDKFACGFLSGLPLDDDFPRGGWLPATPAPAKDDTLGLLRQYCRSPAPEELPMVKGRRVAIFQNAFGSWYIYDSANMEYLHKDGAFRGIMNWAIGYHWPDHEAAAAFIAQHADQPAAVSPAATAEQGDESELERLRILAAKVNEIRNSIIGLQTVNWSEHVYPLVAALNDAGIEGMGYPEAREKFGTLLERTNAAEAELAELKRQAETKGEQP